MISLGLPWQEIVYMKPVPGSEDLHASHFLVPRATYNVCLKKGSDQLIRTFFETHTYCISTDVDQPNFFI